MKAARMHEYGKTLVLEDVPVPDIQPDEILVQVTACGMCRSDVQLVDGYFRKYVDIPTPITLGHEITGVVDKIGGSSASRRDFRRATTSSSWPGGATAPAVIARSAIRISALTCVGRGLDPLAALRSSYRSPLAI